MGDAGRVTGRRPACRERRALLRSLGALAAACAAAPLAGPGCRAPDAATGDDVTLPLADLDGDGRAVVTWRERPVEVVRDSGGGITARSLICTHMSCVVRWNHAAGRYECPCHDGVFDADGRPVSGPPRLPLEAVPAAVEGDRVRVGAGAAAG